MTAATVKAATDRAVIVLAAAAAPLLTLLVDVHALSAQVATDIGSVAGALVVGWHTSSAVSARAAANAAAAFGKHADVALAVAAPHDSELHPDVPVPYTVTTTAPTAPVVHTLVQGTGVAGVPPQWQSGQAPAPTGNGDYR